MKNQRVTVKDIAKYVGVSPTTVSNVINKRGGRVSDEIINKVNEAVSVLGYRKNYSALSLKSNKSNLIGVIIPQMERNKSIMLDNPFYAEFIGKLEYRLREAGYHIILSGVCEEDADINYLESWNLDGIILLGAYDKGFYKGIKKMGIPIVLVDSYVDDDYFYKVRIDDELGGYLATNYLLGKGHRNIAFVSGSIMKDGVVEKRFLGYKKALEEYGVEFDRNLVFEKEVSMEFGRESTQFIRSSRKKITAAFAMADIIAAGMVAAFHEQGINVPQEISVVGFDDTTFAEITSPTLTTLNQNIDEKANISAEVMLGILKGDAPKENNIILDISIVERNSVGEV